MYSAEEINGCRPDSRVGGSERLLDEINVWFDIESGEEIKEQNLKMYKCIAVYRCGYC